jgi:hypothetical protein
MLKTSSSSTKVERNSWENTSQERIFYHGYDVLKSKQLISTGFLFLTIHWKLPTTHLSELSMERVIAAAQEIQDKAQ